MKTAVLTWTPSTSPGVEGQQARIFNAESLEPYTEVDLVPTASNVSAEVPEGVTIQGTVTTIRGEEQVTAVSPAVEVGYGPLQPATGLALTAGDVVIQPV